MYYRMGAEEPGREAGRILRLAAILTAAGLIAVYSAGAFIYGDDPRIRDETFLLRRQAMFACAGFLLLLVCSSIHPDRWRGARWWLFAAAFALFAAPYLPGIGVEINGARRWIRAGPYTFQPSEFARPLFILFLAAQAARSRDRLRNLWGGLLPLLAAAFAAVAMIGAAPDVGTAAIAAAAFGLTLYAAGARWNHLAAIGALGLAAGGALALWHFEHVARRIEEWGTGYQIRQSLVAIGAGGWFGTGLGGSVQKLFYLPAAASDFVFAIWAEETGFLGAAALVLLYAAFVMAGLRIAARARDPFRCAAATGLTAHIGLCALANLMVATALLPAKGTPLPFVSAGGSALVAALASTGVLMALAQHEERPDSECGLPSREAAPAGT